VYNCNVIVYIRGMVDINLFMGNIHARKREWSWTMVLKGDYFHRRHRVAYNIYVIACQTFYLLSFIFVHWYIIYDPKCLTKLNAS